MKKLIVVMLMLLVMIGCSGNNSVIRKNYRNNYSVEVVGVTDAAISDGLPEGVNVLIVSKSIFADVVNGLANKGMIKNDNQNKFKVKYSISYFGHKWTGGTSVDFIVGYNVQLIDEKTGNVIASDKNDEKDSELLKVIGDVSDNIVNFAADNIK